MHARRLDAAELADRAAELALERALVVEPLQEVGLAERLLVEDLEAHPAPFGQAAAREREPQLVLALRRHQHRPAAVLELEGHLLGLEGLDDRRGVALREIREQRPIERPLHPPREREDRRERAHAGGNEDDPPRRRLCPEEVHQLGPELLEPRRHRLHLHAEDH